MSKIIILGDTHLACKNGSQIFSKHQQKFFDNVLFPYVEKHKYPIIQLGDLFDQRKFINFVGLDAAVSGFFNRMPKDIDMIALLGNHDISYKETLRVNAPELLLAEYDWLTIVSYPQTLFNKPGKLDGIDFIPWICDENREEVYEFIKKSKSKVCCGHFELAGFSMQKGMPTCHDGMDNKIFDKYKLVLSGHFHTKSTNNNITYVGTPYELTWSDYKDPKGFHVLDTKTFELEFIENPYTLYETIYYNGPNKDVDISKFHEKYVKVVVVDKGDYYEFDTFIGKLNSVGAYDVKIIENYADKALGEIGEEILLKNTQEVLNSYIQSLKLNNTDVLSSYMSSLYVQAQDII